MDQVRDVEAEFHHASDLVHFIKQVFGSKFKIGVAGYPTGHPEATSLEQDLLYLKKKVDEGADFILTQMISSVDEYYTYLKHCFNLGVTVPIIPGLYLIQSFDSFKKFISTCQISVPARMYQDFKKIQDINKEKQYGLRLFQDLIRGLQKTSYCVGIHIFTLNRVSSVLKCLPHEELNSGIL
ncbi:methylenetetrahydrofolate reductase [Frankliniella occidentalis]|uniref:Methylenetetrahydrofolate reductase n=1 Tax=Frankliniella occidentalis TaxID=133901 RepID=A0A9C6XC45_FRAOC|nr:methylenetetrahydrofolate reductase [Frankliniella occidentalis]